MLAYPMASALSARPGPEEPVMVRRKERKLGIWVNVDSVLVDSAPSFYAVATSAPFDQVLTDTEDLRFRVSIERAIRSVGAAMHIRGAQDFADAVVRIRERANLYSIRENTVAVDQQTLFRTAIEMPADLTEGDYSTRIFLTRGGEVISTYETVIGVRKVGKGEYRGLEFLEVNAKSIIITTGVDYRKLENLG